MDFVGAFPDKLDKCLALFVISTRISVNREGTLLQESPLTFIRILAIVLEATTSIEADGSIPFDHRYLRSLFSR